MYCCSLSKDTTDDRLGDSRPVPTPRRSVSSKDTSREPSIAREGGNTPSAHVDIDRSSVHTGGLTLSH